MTHERSTVVAAIGSSPNLNVAARKLGASRRTLQNRMREYHLPYGQAGRRRQALPYRSHHDSTTGIVLLGALVVGGLYWLSKRKPVVVGNATNELHGLDVLISCHR